jgi:hypothetical protein
MLCYLIRPIGFSESEHGNLEAILTIANGRLRENWRWTTNGPADVYLVAAESSLEWERHSAALPRDRLLACTLPGLNIDARWQIRREPLQLPSFRELTRMLDAIGAELAFGDLSTASSSDASKPAGPTSSDREAREEADDFYDPGKHLLGIIRDCLMDGVPRRLTARDGNYTVLIEPERGLCFVSDDKALPSSLLSASRDRIQEQRLGSEQLAHEISVMGSPGMAISDLVFIAALFGSRGRLWIGCRFDEPVRLKRWPDLRHLPQYMEYMGVMAFMSGNTADVKTIAARTGASVEKVINFHNACVALDLLDRGGEVSIREKALNPEIRRLYGKIAKRLQNNEA